MYIISYDIASKSLAVSIIYFNDRWQDQFNSIKINFIDEINNTIGIEKKCDCIVKYTNLIDNLLNTLIIPKFFDVADLIPGKKLKETTGILRTSRLKAYLHLVDCEFKKIAGNTNETVKVLLEYQMGPNDKSRVVGSQVLFHYSNTDVGFTNSMNSCLSINDEHDSKIIYDIEILGPSLKNKINLLDNKDHAFFMKKYSKPYNANKAHSKTNFLQWVKINKVEHMIKNIKKKNIDDIADSVNMTLAWLHIKSGLL